MVSILDTPEKEYVGVEEGGINLLCILGRWCGPALCAGEQC